MRHTLGWVQGWGCGEHHDDCARALNQEACVPGLDLPSTSSCVPLVRSHVSLSFVQGTLGK